MSNVFEHIKDRLSIRDVISNYISLKPAGRTVKGLCPFHNEKTPSFTVNDEQGFFHCFGCGQSGDVISFISKIENLDSMDAVRFLSERYNIDISGFSKKPSMRVDQEASEMLKDAVRYYMSTLKRSDTAKNYLRERGLSGRAAKVFAIGFAPDKWDGLYNALRKKYKPKQMLKYGLINQSKSGKYYDKFRNRIIFPIIDQRRRVVGFGGRSIGDGKPKYLNSSQSELFNKSELLYGLNTAKDSIKETKSLIITEGYMDVVSLYSNGIKNSVGTLGTAFSEAHARLLARYTDSIYLCFDSDTAGVNATLKAIEIATTILKHIRIISLPEGSDPDDFIKNKGMQAFLDKIDEAKAAIEYKIDIAARSFNLNDRNARAEFYKIAVDIINTQEDIIDRSNYATYLVTNYNADKKTILQACSLYSLDKTAENKLKLGDNTIRKNNKLLNPISLMLYVHVNKIMNANDNNERAIAFTEAFKMSFPEKYENLIMKLMEYYEINNEAGIDYIKFAESAGVSASKYLNRLMNSDKSTQDMSYDLVMINYKLYRVEMELKFLKDNDNNLKKIVELKKEKNQLMEMLKEKMIERGM